MVPAFLKVEWEADLKGLFLFKGTSSSPLSQSAAHTGSSEHLYHWEVSTGDCCEQGLYK